MNKDVSNRGFLGVFDSGFGGLEILREILFKLPNYNYIYLGDTKNAPYGERTQKEIYNFTVEAVNFLFKQGCEIIILACNTSSTESLRIIQQDYLLKHFPDKRVLGVVVPAVEEAVKKTVNNRVGVMATNSAVNSGAFTREIKKLNSNIEVFQMACPLLVSIVESGDYSSTALDIALNGYLKPLLKKDIDTLVLGCTHYGLIEKQIRNKISKNINIISEGVVVAHKLQDYLKRHPEINNKLEKNNKIDFFTTGFVDKFEKIGSKFFGEKINAKKVEIF